MAGKQTHPLTKEAGKPVEHGVADEIEARCAAATRDRNAKRRHGEPRITATMEAPVVPAMIAGLLFSAMKCEKSSLSIDSVTRQSTVPQHAAHDT
jgi:hypothetical protein